jgi:hypothetical protein
MADETRVWAPKLMGCTLWSRSFSFNVGVSWLLVMRMRFLQTSQEFLVMRTRLTLAALALSLAVGACGHDTPTSANDGQQSAPEFKQKDRSALLTNVPVTGALSNGAVFNGTVTITRFAYDQATGTLLVSGNLTNAADGSVQAFTDVPATLVSGGAPTAPVCSILVLDIGAIHLDLLGLVVDLAPVHLNITGQTGPGRLLGNLLCGLAGLLNPPGPLAAILDIIARINALLGV